MAKKAAAKAVTKEEKAAFGEPRIDNRRARFEYEFLEKLEAGVMLTGTEIKSVRTGEISLNEAYARVRDGELWLLNLHIPPYKQGSFSNHEPTRPRKLLLHRRELDRFAGRAAEKGLTIVPVRLYFKGGKVKIEIALARGKKLWDKRREQKERDQQRDLRREVGRV
jgi:SsrA-binding protein